MQQRGGDVVAALVGEKSQVLIGVEGVEAAVLQHVGAQLVRQPDAAPFLIEIEQHAAAERADARDRRAQLLAAIAAQAAEQVAGEAGRVQAHGHGARGIGLADDDRDVLGEAVLVAEHGDLALERVGERHARAAEELQSVVAETRRVMHDVAEGDREHAWRDVAVGVETDKRRNEAPRLRELECGGRERRAARRRVDVECAAVDGRVPVDACERAQLLEVRRPAGRRRPQGRSIGATSPAASARSAVMSMTARPSPAATSRANNDACSVSIVATISPRCTVGDLNRAATAQLVDRSVEGQRGGVAVDFLVFWRRHCKRRVFLEC